MFSNAFSNKVFFISLQFIFMRLPKNPIKILVICLDFSNAKCAKSYKIFERLMQKTLSLFLFKLFLLWAKKCDCFLLKV